MCGNMTGSRCITQTCTVRLRKSSPSRNTENIINEEKHQLMYSLTAEVRHATGLDTVPLLFLSCPSAPNRSVGGESGAAAAAWQSFPPAPPYKPTILLSKCRTPHIQYLTLSSPSSTRFLCLVSYQPPKTSPLCFLPSTMPLLPYFFSFNPLQSA